MTRLWWRRLVSGVGVLAVSAGCSRGGPAGLGVRACPYVRPRLLRVDRDLLEPSSADLGAVAQDFALYVSQLPAGGKAKADRELVRFATALGAVTRAGATSADTAALAQAEAALKRRCRVVS